jgi:hypothetical protein
MDAVYVYSFLYINISSTYRYLVPYVMYFYHETNMKYVSYRLREINDFDFDFFFIQSQDAWNSPYAYSILYSYTSAPALFRFGQKWILKKRNKKSHACVPLKKCSFPEMEIRIYKLCTVLTPHVSFNCFSGWRVRRPHEDIWFFSNNICVLYAKRVSLFLNK